MEVTKVEVASGGNESGGNESGGSKKVKMTSNHCRNSENISNGNNNDSNFKLQIFHAFLLPYII